MTIWSQILGLIYAMTGSQQARQGFNLWTDAKMWDPWAFSHRKGSIFQGSESTFTSSMPQIKTQHGYNQMVNTVEVQVHCLRSDQIIIYNFNEKRSTKCPLMYIRVWVWARCKEEQVKKHQAFFNSHQTANSPSVPQGFVLQRAAP